MNDISVKPQRTHSAETRRYKSSGMN